jgi:biotin operon repressor
VQGWVKLHRQFINWEWYDSATHVAFFLHCLLMANHKTKQWRGITINPGEFVTSHAKLAKQTGLTVRQVRKRIDDLKKTGEMATKTNNQHTKIIMLNWEKFQVDGEQNGGQESIKGQSKGNQRATTNNDNNNNNENNDFITPKITHDDVIQLWNDTMPQHGFKYCRGLGGGEHLRNFVEATKWMQDKKSWQELFELCAKSNFLNGTDGKWRVNLTWLVNYDNALKVFNGNFEDNEKSWLDDWAKQGDE